MSKDNASISKDPIDNALDLIDSEDPMEIQAALEAGANIDDLSDEDNPDNEEEAQADESTDKKADDEKQEDSDKESDGEKSEADKKSESESSPDESEDPKGVYTKNEQHIMPYSVVTKLRGDNSSLKDELSAKELEIKALKDQLASNEKQSTEAAENLTEDQQELVDTGDFEALRDELPDAYVNVLEKQAKQIADLNKKAAEVDDLKSSLEQDRQSVRNARIQSHLDAVPELKDWQNTMDETDWNNVLLVKDGIFKHPDWKNKSPTDVFKETVRRYKFIYGIQDVPGQDEADGENDELTPAQKVKQRVDAAKREADKAAIPRSHSDIPAGSAPAQSSMDMYEKMSEHELQEAFSTMSSEKVEEILSRIA